MSSNNGKNDVFDQPTVVIGGPSIAAAAAAAAAAEANRAAPTDRTVIASSSTSQVAGSIDNNRTGAAPAPAPVAGAAHARTVMRDPSGIAAGAAGPRRDLRGHVGVGPGPDAAARRADQPVRDHPRDRRWRHGLGVPGARHQARPQGRDQGPAVEPPELTQRFIIEARATARCSHENIVIIYEVGEHGGQPYMVLEFLSGTTLTDLVTGGKRLPPARVIELMVPVVKALVVAHEQGIVHRDLKPDNIFVTEQGTIKVLDFGIAKVRDQATEQAPSGTPSAPSNAGIRLPTAAELGEHTNTNLTRQGVIMGTMKYMSPEQWGIGVEIDHRTDIWAVGVILYRLLAGKHPLAPLQGNQLVVTAMVDKPMPKLREAVSDVPQGICDVVDRCLQKHKEYRFKDARELLKALEPFLPGRYSTMQLQLDESPYAGLSSFQESDAARFFGRSREIAAAVNRIRDRPIMGVVGPSGVGKSSFVRAGLVPALKSSGENWETLVIRPGRNPLMAIAAMMSPMVSSTSTTVVDELKEQAELARSLAAAPGHMGQVLRARARRANRKILLFVDQFEELYTLVADPAERAAFTACLVGAADDASAPVRVALSLRSDFLDRVGEDPHLLTEVMQGLFFLTPPGRDGLRDALVQPAEMAGYHFENPQMVEEMLSHLETTPGALPLLQFAATKLWDAKDSTRKLLTQNAYASMGGIAGALASHADSVLSELSPQSQALARQLFLRLITPERTRAIVSLAELAELSPGTSDVQRLVDHLTTARLLVTQTASDGSAQGSTVEVVHESLIHSWPSLKRWLDETQEDSQFVEQLRIAAKQWAAKGKDPGMLWRGETAEEAMRWVKRNKSPVPQSQKLFLDAVIAEATRADRRRRTFTIGLVTFLTLLLVAAAGALLTIRKSEKAAADNAVRAARNAEDAAKAAQLAQANEKTAKEALAAAEEKERQRLLAEKEKEKETLRADRTTEQLDQTYEDLLKSNASLKDALEEATEAKDDARKAQKAAEAAAAAAQAAEEKERVAKEDAQRLRAAAEKRAADFERRLGQIEEDLK
jgi:serine/threonine protein kinase